MFWAVFAFFAAACLASFVLAPAGRWLAKRAGAVDAPTGGRKIHQHPTPLFGGVGIGAAIIIVLCVALFFGFVSGRMIGEKQVLGYLVALLVLLVGGLMDDRWSLPPRFQILFPCAAAAIVVLSGTSIVHVTNVTSGTPFSLAWVSWHGFVFPADVLAFAWLVVVTYATKLMDGLDGLVAGQAVIGAGLIAALALSATYYQPAVAVVACIIAGAYLGFLPSNLFPAKQFLGEAGSTIAGFSLGVLSILGGAKVAIGLMALGLPLADASLVVLGRLLRGVSPFRGDDTHLHFKLLQAGLSQRQVVLLLWLITVAFGVAALGLQSRGKLLLAGALVLVTVILSLLASVMRKRV